MHQNEQVLNYCLANGIKVYISKMNNTSISCFLICYGVGSGLDPSGQTGISHFLEHLMYKGTSSVTNGELQKKIWSVGGEHSALTSLDYTYFFTLIHPTHLETIMKLEADRMLNLKITDNQVEIERQIILAERASAIKTPKAKLYEELWLTAFTESSYRNLVIGNNHDIKMINSQLIQEHYHKYYRPDNATIIIAGDVNPYKTIENIQRYFGSISKPESSLMHNYISEPIQNTKRKKIIESSTNIPYTALAWKTPIATHPDRIKFDLLKIILSGASPYLKDGKTIGITKSLLYDFVSKNSSIFKFSQSSILDSKNEGVFIISNGMNTTMLDEAEDFFLEHFIENIKQANLENIFLDSAIQLAKRQYIYAKDSVLIQTINLAKSIIKTGSPFFWTNYIEQLEKTSLNDIKETFNKYFVTEKLSVLSMIPNKSLIKTTGTQVSRSALKYSLDHTSITKGKHISVTNFNFPNYNIKETILNNGLKILNYKKVKSNTITIRMTFEAGALFDPITKKGLSFLTSQLAYKTALLEADEGIMIEALCDLETISFVITCTTDDFINSLQLLSKTFITPEYDSEIFSWIRAQKNYSSKIHYSKLYPKKHILNRAIEGTKSTQGLTLKDVYLFINKNIKPQGSIITISSDLPESYIIDSITHYFSNWDGTQHRYIIPETSLAQSFSEHISLQSSITDIKLFWMGVQRNHPDYLKLSLLAYILGKKDSNYGGRLWETIREQLGYSYYQNVYFESTGYQSPWMVNVGVSHENTEVVLKVIKNQINKLKETGSISKNELELLLAYLHGNFYLLLENPKFITYFIEQCVRFNLGLNYITELQYEIRNITIKQLEQTAINYLDESNLVVVTSGPFQI